MRKSAERRKAEIVTVVLALADRIGPDRVTTGAVATAIGVTQAALFRHFPTKAALWQAVAEHVAEGLAAAWEDAISRGDGPIVRLRALIAAQFAQIAATPALPMLLFSRELNVTNAELRATFHGLLTAFRGLLAREVDAGQEAGILRGDIETADAAVLLTSLVQGVAIRWALGARDFDLRDEGLRLFEVQLRLLAAEGE
ncbi:TetR/AcrR family transcriptional regulator [Seohaeicola zhoushanensis]|uniref:TetR family transcriptional regulator n=1 Tax=Seohaeicola zhoushanensis TaxID=1569283 RepID=A0A8J3H322_9RHOB|nr:TetR/AcrR family transcriptional regulator [Seohaeicola zhoushanensis]GHF71967.1 TetR family transcriptional regulator [Seohaeicola zhoushanensis]